MNKHEGSSDGSFECEYGPACRWLRWWNQETWKFDCEVFGFVHSRANRLWPGWQGVLGIFHLCWGQEWEVVEVLITKSRLESVEIGMQSISRSCCWKNTKKKDDSYFLERYCKASKQHPHSYPIGVTCHVLGNDRVKPTKLRRTASGSHRRTRQALPMEQLVLALWGKCILLLSCTCFLFCLRFLIHSSPLVPIKKLLWDEFAELIVLLTLQRVEANAHYDEEKPLSPFSGCQDVMSYHWAEHQVVQAETSCQTRSLFFPHYQAAFLAMGRLELLP